MGKRKRKKRSVRKQSPNVGKKQLQEQVSGGETPEVLCDATEPDSLGGPAGGGGDRLGPDSQAEEQVEADVRGLPSDAPSGPTEEQLGDWRYRVVRSPGDVLELGTWLQNLGGEVEKPLVGVAASSTGIAFATKDRGWLITHDIPTAREVLGKVLTTERHSPALITRDTVQLVADLHPWLEPYDQPALAANVVHDLSVLEYVTGVAAPRGLPLVQDALDCAVVGPGMAIDTPQFYQKVGMPIARFGTRTAVETMEDQSRWVLTYEWLLFKVLAHQTRDPVLTRWFQEGINPMSEFASLIELDSTQSIAMLLWLVCGERDDLLSKYHPEWLAALPDSPQLVKATRIDKSLPNLRLGLIRLTEQYTASRRATTLYGRRSPWGYSPEELLHYSIMGSIDDILDVAVASLINLGSTHHWLQRADAKHERWLRAQVVGYTDRDSMEWQRQLEELGTLNNPLGIVPLEPKVSVE